MTAPAPLAAAIEEAREAQRYDLEYCGSAYSEYRYRDMVKQPDGDWVKAEALDRLLLALDADDRLAKAEKRLRAILDYEPKEVCKDEFAYDRMVEAYREVARRYFAEKGDDHG